MDRQSGHDVSTYLAGVEQNPANWLLTGSPSGCYVINDDSNDVGAVHLGIVHLFELDTDRVRANGRAGQLRLGPEELSGRCLRSWKPGPSLRWSCLKTGEPEALRFHEARRA
ncbi:MAG: hypothetical protein ACLT8E_11950 [Akkermansia sp.]